MKKKKLNRILIITFFILICAVLIGGSIRVVAESTNGELWKSLKINELPDKNGVPNKKRVFGRNYAEDWGHPASRLFYDVHKWTENYSVPNLYDWYKDANAIDLTTYCTQMGKGMPGTNATEYTVYSAEEYYKEKLKKTRECH